MNLEQRVQALEQEVELLKAQIQATLLDIQEQLLINTYPTLRAESGSMPSAPAPALEPQSAPAVTSLPVKKVILTDSLPDDDEVEPEPVVEMPVVRKVVPVEKPTQPSVPERDVWEEQSTYNNERDTSAHDWIALENWVSEKVERLGIERTRDLVHLYARQERFTRQERSLLLEFIDIYADGGEQKPSAPKKSEPARKPPTTHPTIVPQTRAVVDEIRAELRQKRARMNHQQAVPEEISEQQGLVLRLIAGILNAGDEADPVPSNGHRKY